jgi:hypothetical protein
LASNAFYEAQRLDDGKLRTDKASDDFAAPEWAVKKSQREQATFLLPAASHGAKRAAKSKPRSDLRFANPFSERSLPNIH